ncbi:MAG: hypothetical protein GY775_16050 [Candidatus Scalindua sp.]|nr:hypothetical protein [Candidatus Scalindua sp.]
MGGRRGTDTGEHPRPRRIRSAKRKLRNRLATNKSCRNRCWNISLGSEFQAIVSVIAVNIQFSFPRGVFRSPSLPGISATQFGSMPAIRSGFCSVFDNKTCEDEVVVAHRHTENMIQGCGYYSTLLA